MEELLRALLKRGIIGANSHPDVSTVFDGLEYPFTGIYASPIPNTIWQIAEHMHLWVKLKVDLFEGLQIIMPDGHGFGTMTVAKSAVEWNDFKLRHKASIARIYEMVDTIDLTRRYPVWGNLSAAEIIGVMINHNSYHSAQIIAMRRVLGVWNRN